MRRRLTSLIPILALALATACGSKPKKKPEPVTQPTENKSDKPTGSVDKRPTEVVEGELAQAILTLRRVHFAFDGLTLEKPARDSLTEASAILVKHPDIVIRVMGHADERGTEEYNIALGEKRARVVVDFMGRLGVAKDRLKVVSFGEEKPLDDGHDIEAMARNRRVDFELLRGGSVKLVVAEGELNKAGDPLKN